MSATPVALEEVASLLNELETVSRAVDSAARKTKSPTIFPRSYKYVVGEYDLDKNEIVSKADEVKGASRFSAPALEAAHGDYAISAEGFPSCFEWLEEQTRNRSLPGITSRSYSAIVYREPGPFQGEWEEHPAIRIKRCKIILRPEDAPIYKEVLAARIAALKVNPKLRASQKEKIKGDFRTATEPKRLVELFGLKADLGDRTPGDLQSEARLAVQLAKIAAKTPPSEPHDVSRVTTILAESDREAMLTSKEKQDAARAMAQSFVEARRLGPTMEEMGLSL